MKIKGPAGFTPHMKRVLIADKKLKEAYPDFTNERPPRSRAKWEALKMIERRTGRKVGTIGYRVWVDDADHNKGFVELDEDGNEVKWFPYPEKGDDENDV